MKRLIMLIDDDSEKIGEVNLMENALKSEIKKCGFDEQIDVLGHQITPANLLTKEELEELKVKIKSNIKKYEKVLIAIDLNLVGNTYNSLFQLKQYIMTGIKLKQIIYESLDDEEKQKVKFVFISAFMDKTSTLRQELDSTITNEQAVGVLKPKVKWNSVEYEKGVKKHERERKICSINQGCCDKIQQYYAEETIYGDFIGTILENILI